MHGDHLLNSRRGFLAAGLGFVGATALGGGALAAAPDLAAVARRELERVGSRVRRRDVVGVVDFARPSKNPRFHLIDMAGGKVESLYVSHGRGSDPAHSGWVERFSNAFGSNASSQGAYLTADYYVGKHGRSMNLEGLDPTNDNAMERRIVVHGAWYVSAEMARTKGVLGRSEGCFAVAENDLAHVLDRLGPGRLLVAGKFQA